LGQKSRKSLGFLGFWDSSLSFWVGFWGWVLGLSFCTPRGVRNRAADVFIKGDELLS
jgi:hypothetical protein